jgi:hypothetical protein
VPVRPASIIKLTISQQGEEGEVEPEPELIEPTATKSKIHSPPQNKTQTDGRDRKIYFFHPVNPSTLQSTFLKLRATHPPAYGTSPRILLSATWSQPTRLIPAGATTAVYIPNSRYGDIIGVFHATKATLKYPNGKVCLTYGESVKSNTGGIHWANFSNGSFIDLINLGLRARNLPPIDPTLSSKPFGDVFLAFLPHEDRYEAWLQAAEQWCKHYEVPSDEQLFCRCRKSGLEKGGPMIECDAGPDSCMYVWWHLICLGISEDVEVQEEGTWWCPVCIERWPDLANCKGLSQNEGVMLKDVEDVEEKEKLAVIEVENDRNRAVVYGGEDVLFDAASREESVKGSLPK